jgi:hypothetical protein
MKTKIITIKIPKYFFEQAIEQVKDFLGIENIGKVYLPSGWNNWGDSQEKAGNIRPKPEMEMHLEGDYYITEAKLTIGAHKFKPAVVSATADKNGMSEAIWIACPDEGLGEYEQEKSDAFKNWLVKIK